MTNRKQELALATSMVHTSRYFKATTRLHVSTRKPKKGSREDHMRIQTMMKVKALQHREIKVEVIY